MKQALISGICTFLATLSIMGCSTKDNMIESIQNADSTRSGLQSSSPKGGQLISQNMISGILKGYLVVNQFPGIDNYSLKIVSEDGYNLIYVVNFDEGGWVLISGVLFPNASPILGYAFEGKFDPDEIRSPEVAFWLEATKRKIAEQIRANIR